MTHSAQAASQIWDGGGADANWSTVTNWVGDPTAAPGNTASVTNSDIATFNAAIANTWGAAGSPIIIDSTSQNLGGISFDAAADSYYIGDGVNPLLLSSGGTVQILGTLAASDALETLNAPLVIEGASAAYTFANNSASGAGAGVGTLVIGGGITGVAAGATVLTLDGSNTNANTLGGIVANGTATTLGITKSGAGTWNLPAANTFTGPIIVNNGLLALGAMTIGTAQTLTLTGGTLSLGSGDGAVNLDTAATGTGTLALEGLGTKTLTNLGASYDGNIVITASPVQAVPPDPNAQQVLVTTSGDNAFGSTVGSTTITNNGTGIIYVKTPVTLTPLAENFVINAGSGFVSFGTNFFDATRSGDIQINSGTLLFNNGGYRTSNTGVISGPGGIAMINPADVFKGANTFSGGVRVGLSGTGWNGTYGITQGVTVEGSDTLSGGAILNGPLGTGTVTFTAATGTWTGAGRLADNGPSPGPITTTLHNNVIQRNAMTFASQPGGATLVTNSNTMIITDAGLTAPSTWTLEPCPNVYSNVPPDTTLGIPGTQGSTLPLIMGITVNTNYTAQIDQVIGQNMGVTPGNMTLRKVGAGTLILGRVNTYGGDTMAMQGNLKLGVANALPTGTKLAVGGGIYLVADWPELGLVPPVATPLGVNLSGNTVYGTFDLNGYDQTVGGIGQSSDSSVPANNIVTNSSAIPATLTVNNAVANSFGGTFSGNLNLAKGGIGTLTSTGTNTYTGDTVVQNGTLSISTTDLADGADVKLYTGGNLDLNTSGATDTVRSLYIDGVPQVTGLWGATGSGATYTSDLITGSGFLNVLTLGGTLTYSISGKVVLSGAGLSGVTVSDGTRTATTDGSGNYTITGVPDAATYTVTPSLSGYTFTPVSSPVPVMGVNVTGTNFTATLPGGYSAWAALNAGGQAADLDFDNDGVSNGVEYFMGQTGSSFTANPGVVAGTVTWARDPAAVIASFIVQVSDNLTTWTDVVPPDPSIDETNPTQVTYTLPTGAAKKFCRLVVTP